ncbi:metallophosphoesterase [Brevibacillus sp. NPDC058079]|uniref:metallophosphoesterase n=1 Tax=Brevibacillus sp. NPDC058079 TaxID=3346330 RepID=UPI0036E96217
MDELFVIGDIHGELDKLHTLLTKWKQDSQKLVFLGDYVDRGKQSCGVIQLVRKLHKQYGAEVIGGNHESLFLQWLDDPEDFWFLKWVEDESSVNEEEEAGMSESIAYYSLGGNRTIDSFYGKACAYRYLPSRHAEYIKANFDEEIAFLRGLPHFFEWKEYVCVHAGVNLAYVDWKKTSDVEYRWIRKPFHYMKNDTNKIFIFGHEQTKHLHKNGTNEIWISPCRTKIGIDGGAVFGGLLHGVVVGGEQMIVYSTDQKGNLYHQVVLL